MPLPQQDCSELEGFAEGMCQAQPRSKKEKRCTENSVSIDPKYEEAARAKYLAAYTELNSQHLMRTQSCLSKVAQITAEEAYVYYSQRIEPQADSKATSISASPIRQPVTAITEPLSAPE